MDETPDERVQPAQPAKLTRAQMLDQLGVMASQIAEDAPPALREATARAAELAAEAARSAGPLAQRLAEVTDDASLRFADRSERFAVDVRAGAPATTTQDDDTTEEPASEPASE